MKPPDIWTAAFSAAFMADHKAALLACCGGLAGGALGKLLAPEWFGSCVVIGVSLGLLGARWLPRARQSKASDADRRDR